MPENNQPNKEGPDDKKGGDLKVPPRTLLIWIAILGVVPLVMFFHNQGDMRGRKDITYPVLSIIVTNHLLVPKVNVITYDHQNEDVKEITGRYYTYDEATYERLPDAEEIQGRRRQINDVGIIELELAVREEHARNQLRVNAVISAPRLDVVGEDRRAALADDRVP